MILWPTGAWTGRSSSACGQMGIPCCMSRRWRQASRDDVVLNRANQESALLLTADKDFGEMVYRQYRLASGVVLIRLAGLSSAQKPQIVASAIADHIQEMSKAFTVIEPGACASVDPL